MLSRKYQKRRVPACLHILQRKALVTAYECISPPCVNKYRKCPNLQGVAEIALSLAASEKLQLRQTMSDVPVPFTSAESLRELTCESDQTSAASLFFAFALTRPRSRFGFC
jgi:hypothetical protein